MLLRPLFAILTAFTIATPVVFALQGVATVGGTVKSISSDGKKITVAVGGGGAASEETLQVGARTQVTIDGKASKLTAIAPGTSVTITYDKLAKTATVIRARTGEKSANKSAPSKTSDSGTESPASLADESLKKVAAKVPWTTNLAQMKIPEGRASGTICGQDFVLEDAKLAGGILTLRQGKEFFADAEIKVFLFLKDEEKVDGKKYRVEAREQFSVPHVHASARPKGTNASKTELVNDKYAMILEFGRTAAGQLPGKIYLCLSDQAKTVVAGHFVVEVFDSTHPLATETLISGRFTAHGPAKDLEISLGCVGKNQEGKMESPGGGFRIGGGTNSVTSTTWPPRFTTVEWDEKTNSGAHKHVNRPPGHYLVYLRGNKQSSNDGALNYEGYYDWKWIELKDAKTNVAVDLVIDPENAGTVEVSVTGSTRQNAVVYLPLDSDGKLPLPEAAQYLQGTSSAKLEGGKATIRGLRPGKYQVALGPWKPDTFEANDAATVEVKRGETARVELTAKAIESPAKTKPAPASTKPAPANKPGTAQPKTDAKAAKTGTVNLVRSAKASASSQWGIDQQRTDFTTDKAVDGHNTTRWQSKDGDAAGAWFAAQWEQPVTINKVVVQQAYDRIIDITLQRFDDSKKDWVDLMHVFANRHLSSYSREGGPTGWGYAPDYVHVDGRRLEDQKDRTFGDPKPNVHPAFTINLPEPLVTSGIRLVIKGTKQTSVSLFELEAY